MTALRRMVDNLRHHNQLRRWKIRYLRQLSHAEWYVEFHRLYMTDAYVASQWGIPTDADVYADRWMA